MELALMQPWLPDPNPSPDQITLSYVINPNSREVIWVEGRYEDIKSVAGRAVDFEEIDWSKLKTICVDHMCGPESN